MIEPDEKDLQRRNGISWLVILTSVTIVVSYLFFLPRDHSHSSPEMSQDMKIMYAGLAFFVSCFLFLPIRKFGFFNRILVFLGGLSVLSHMIFMFPGLFGNSLSLFSILITLAHCSLLVFFYWKTKFLIGR